MELRPHWWMGHSIRGEGREALHQCTRDFSVASLVTSSDARSKGESAGAVCWPTACTALEQRGRITVGVG
eukprot:10841225-Alexandrium_andersonii.AAC.1